MKSVLISIQPKWCELIENGKKTVEVRKTKPKLETPFKCYIYETLGEKIKLSNCVKGTINRGVGKVIGEFVCDEIIDIDYGIEEGVYFDGEYQQGFETNGEGNNPTCLSLVELEKYLTANEGYGWHISNLVIYDKPRELSEFYTVDNEAVKQCEHRERVYNNPDFTNGAWLLGSYVCNKDETDWCTKCKTKSITKPPQSWCYVESEE